MNGIQETEQRLGGPRRVVRLGGVVLGSLMLASAAVFLVNVVYQALRLQAWDEMVAAMIGVAAVYCLIGVLLIGFFARPGSNRLRAYAAIRAAEIVRSSSTRSVGKGGFNA